MSPYTKVEVKKREKRSAYFSSSSSMKPLLSWSMTLKAFLMSSALLAARPIFLKNSLYLKESAAVRRQTRNRVQALQTKSDGS